MEDILQQIQQLKEDFMNLKEVDDVGLGQPASDTPPSTNKIKRDRKTKNGKVEVVSVEDELFPYDGNKREQYRQKIIDTVNAMIQGTATLDDLLQVVREKKGVKTLVKEDLYDQIRKVYGAPEYYYDDSDEYDGYRYRPDNKSAKLMAKVGELQQKERKEAAKRELGKDTITEIGKIMGKREDTKNSEGERKTAVRREERHRAPVKKDSDKLEEALEILEEMIGESNYKRKHGNPNAADGDTVGYVGTKFFKDGSTMHPHRITKSNGRNGVSYTPRGTEYNDFDDKKVLQDAIKKTREQGSEMLDNKSYNNIIKNLTNPTTKYQAQTSPFRLVAAKLANRHNSGESKALDKSESLDKLEEAMSILEELIAEKGMDGRPDLLDHISKGLTGKTVGQHFRNGLNHIVKRGLRKWSQGSQTNVGESYENPLEAPKLLLEELINELFGFRKPNPVGINEGNQEL